jgi:hypothetical protein
MLTHGAKCDIQMFEQKKMHVVWEPYTKRIRGTSVQLHLPPPALVFLAGNSTIVLADKGLTYLVY